MRCRITMLVVLFILLLGGYALAQRDVETVGGKNLWSYMIFLLGGLAVVYFVFRGNKRA